jgi:hypothetical protein
MLGRCIFVLKGNFHPPKIGFLYYHRGKVSP